MNQFNAGASPVITGCTGDTTVCAGYTTFCSRDKSGCLGDCCLFFFHLAVLGTQLAVVEVVMEITVIII